ncbi:hypothetical protein POV27_11065 [Aureisphaera galaxeae]|uniref:hypothetical protein n=1 Tax=Aureisphaera galaxeae TaxID=1538023 RepID=UPI002350005B|nr:hypothetical protein [Aureisphaera galaxeae]MDC8004590.1 hypothetical protein [Aureisphaera galaxeae]
MLLLDICITFIVFLIGFNYHFFSGMRGRSDKKLLRQLFFYHFGIAIAFHFYLTFFGGDAVHYWKAPKTYSLDDILAIIDQGSATGVVYLLNYIPSKVLQLSFFTGNMMYALLGYIGFVYLIKIMQHIFPELDSFEDIRIFNIPLFPWIWFLPNLHFWSSGIGKDSLLFFSIAMFVYALIDFRKRWLLIMISIILSFVIRPHILLFLLFAFGVGFMMDNRLKGYLKVLLFLVFLVGFISIFGYVQNFIQLESLEVSAINEFASERSANLNKARTGSGVDISGYPFPLKLFTFLFRPLFFDINGILAVIASVENFILLIFTVQVFRRKPFKGFRTSNYMLKAFVVYFLLGSVAFSLILGNLGIMIRQKNMLVPYWIIFGLWSLYYFQQQKKLRLANTSGH